MALPPPCGADPQVVKIRRLNTATKRLSMTTWARSRVSAWLARPSKPSMAFGLLVVKRPRGGPKPFAGSVWPTFPANSLIVWSAALHRLSILPRHAPQRKPEGRQ